MEKIKNYFSGEWYKKKSFAIAVAVIVLVIAGACVAAVVVNNNNKADEEPQITMTYTEVKDHYGIYREEVSGMYACRDVNDNKLTGYRVVVRAEMKKPMTKEEIYNDAMVIDKECGAVETEIHFIYKLDNTYNVTVYVCKGKIFTVSMEGRKFLTRDEWLAGFENKEA